MEPGKIYERIAAIMKEVKAISKSQKNQQQGFMFRGIDNIMNDLHNLFAKNEVFILPEVLSYTTEERPTKSGGINTFTRSTIKFTYATTDGSSVSTITVGEAMDSGDKGMNKAMSVALKYSLLQMLLIPTNEVKDPNAFSPESDFLAKAMLEVSKAKSVDELRNVFNKYTTLHTNREFISAVNGAKAALSNVYS